MSLCFVLLWLFNVGFAVGTTTVAWSTSAREGDICTRGIGGWQVRKKGLAALGVSRCFDLVWLFNVFIFAIGSTAVAWPTLRYL